MKSFMIFLNSVVLVLIAMLLLMHFLHSAPEPDKILSQTPALPREIASGRYDSEIPFNLPKIEKMTKRNLFHPDRGKLPENPQASLPPINVSNLELIGIYRYKNKAGAIIRDSGVITPKLNPPAPVPGSSPSSAPPPPKTVKLYKVGDQLPNGATLKSVEEKSVVLEFNGKEIPLEIDIGDKGSSDRLKTAQALKTTPPVVMSAKTQPGARTPQPAAIVPAVTEIQPPASNAAPATPTETAKPQVSKPPLGRFNRPAAKPIPTPAATAPAN